MRHIEKLDLTFSDILQQDIHPVSSLLWQRDEISEKKSESSSDHLVHTDDSVLCISNKW